MSDHGPSPPGHGPGIGTSPLSTGAVRYEIVFDCRDRMLGTRLLDRLERSMDDASEIKREEEGPTWSLHVAFRSPRRADEFFRSDAYRQFCIEARRTCRSSVLVVPLGPVDT